MFVAKKTGEWRMALDYRPVNKHMIPDAYPLPETWDLCQKAAGHRYYTALDWNNGFWNVKLKEGCKGLTAINTPIGLYEFNVLPFGIKNSPAECQRVMDHVFAEADEYSTRYIDDIVFWADDEETHDERLRNMLKLAVDGGIYLKLKKIIICKEEVDMLGHMVGLRGIRPSPSKIQGVFQATAPKNQSEVRGFLGLTSYLRNYVPHLAEISEPLTRLTRKDQPYVWAEEQQLAFQEVKEAVCDAISLAAPKGRGPFLLITDASDIGLGCVFAQEQEGEPVILSFASKKLTPAERNWSVSERELYAIVWACRKYHSILRGAKVIVLTDHAALKYLDTLAVAGKIQRWALWLQQYDLTVRHMKGKDNSVADWLSRNPEDELM